MVEVYGRVAVKFKVDEKLFKEDSDKALRNSLLEGNAQINAGDNYLPQPWNTDAVEDDLGFELPILPIPGDLTSYIEDKINKVSDELREKEHKIQDIEMNSNDPEEIEALEKDANILEGRLIELYEFKRKLSTNEK